MNYRNVFFYRDNLIIKYGVSFEVFVSLGNEGNNRCYIIFIVWWIEGY